jgi:rhodanese-related sulfurtransferase
MFGFREIDADTLAQWLEQGESVRLVDVRTPGETARGIIEGAELLPLHLLPLHISEFNNTEHLVFYCQSGARSAQACMFLAQQGAGGAVNLNGGIMAWLRSGRAIVAPAESAVS